jgi:hypothetical protein
MYLHNPETFGNIISKLDPGYIVTTFSILFDHPQCLVTIQVSKRLIFEIEINELHIVHRQWNYYDKHNVLHGVLV